MCDPIAALPAWQAERLAVLLDALGGLSVSFPERASLAVLAGQDPTTVEHLAAILHRARAGVVVPGCPDCERAGTAQPIPARAGLVACKVCGASWAQSPGEEQAGFLLALAAHLAAHPHLVPVNVGPRVGSLCPVLQVWTSDEDAARAAAELVAWFTSLDTERLRVRLQDGYAEVHATVELRGYPARVWGTVDGLQRLLVQAGHPAEIDGGLDLTLHELAHFAEHATLPARTIPPTSAPREVEGRAER